MAASETLSLPATIFERTCWVSTSTFTRNWRSAIVIPEVCRNLLKSAFLGNDCLIWSSSCFCTAAGLAVRLRASASLRSHCDWIRNCITCVFSPLYCCWHWALSAATEGFVWPFGVGWFWSAATHLAYVGGSGTAGVAVLPGATDCLAATLNQWAHSGFLIGVPSTVATELEGTPLPHPVTTSATATVSRARTGSSFFVISRGGVGEQTDWRAGKR